METQRQHTFHASQVNLFMKERLARLSLNFVITVHSRALLSVDSTRMIRCRCRYTLVLLFFFWQESEGSVIVLNIDYGLVLHNICDIKLLCPRVCNSLYCTAHYNQAVAPARQGRNVPRVITQTVFPAVLKSAIMRNTLHSHLSDLIIKTDTVVLRDGFGLKASDAVSRKVGFGPF